MDLKKLEQIGRIEDGVQQPRGYSMSIECNGKTAKVLVNETSDHQASNITGERIRRSLSMPARLEPAPGLTGW